MELRVLGRRLEGVVMVYGALARDRAERFEPGAFDPVPAQTPLNVQHDSTLQVGLAQLTDSPSELRMHALLGEGSGVHDLVRRGALAGLSVEFRSLVETRDNAGTRVISKAKLEGLAVVDQGSYQTRLEARQAVEVRQRSLSGMIPYGTTRTVAQTGRVRKRRYEAGSLDDAVTDPEREIVVTIGRSRTAPGSTIGSKLARGAAAVTFRLLRQGQGVEWEIEDPPETEALRDLHAQSDAGIRFESHAVTLPDTRREDNGVVLEDEPDSEEGVQIEVVQSALLTGIALYPSTSPGTGSEEDVVLEAEQRRRRGLLALI